MVMNPDGVEVEISDEAEYEGKEVSMKEVIMIQIKKIGNICCQEFTGGYWNKKPVKTSTGILFTEEYHEDKREAYCNAINFLIDIIYPVSDEELQKLLDKEMEDTDATEIKQKMKNKRKAFQEINKMFERTNFYKSIGIRNE